MTTKDYQTRSPLRIFLSYFKPHRRLFALDLSCAFLIACIDLAFPQVSRAAMYTWQPQRQIRVFFIVMAVVVAAAAEVEEMRQIIARCGLDRFVLRVVPGGAERQDSVRCGLDALPGDAECVLIHDGARALVTEDVIRRAVESVEARGSGIASVPVSDTIKRAAPDGRVLETPERAALYAMQTPQAFRVELIRQAHDAARRDGFLGTDDASLLEHAGLPVYLCEGSRENLKLTTPTDLMLAELILAARAEKELMR